MRSLESSSSDDEGQFSENENKTIGSKVSIRYGGLRAVGTL